jgi:hypothetical protein
MFPLRYRNDEEFRFLRRTYLALPWYKKLFFPSALKEVLVTNVDFRTPAALWKLYDAYFNHPGWFQRFFNWTELFANVETTRLLAPLAEAGLLTGSQGRDNFYTLMSNDPKHRQHIFFMLRHYPRLFDHALNPQQDFNRLFITYKRELMFEYLMGMIVTQGLAHADDIGHMLDPMAPQGKGGIYLHKLEEWAFIHPLYQSHIDGIIYAQQANNREQVTYHVNSLLDALTGHDVALGSLAMIMCSKIDSMDAKVDRITQILLDKYAEEWLEKQVDTLAAIECDIANFHIGLDSNEYNYDRCSESLNAFRKSIKTLSHIYTGTDQAESWQKIRADLSKEIRRLINHKSYRQLRNEQEFNNQSITLGAFAQLLRRMVGEDWANQPEKSELVRQSKLLVYAVSLLATLDESFIDDQQNKQLVIEHKFFKNIFDFISDYEQNTQQDETTRERANQALTKEACTYLHGLELNSLLSDVEKEELKEQVLSLYLPFARPNLNLNLIEDLPSNPYEILLKTHQGHDEARTFSYLLNAIVQATTFVATDNDTDFLWQLINQRIGSLTADLEPQTIIDAFDNYTLEIHSRLISQLKPSNPYVYLVASCGALYLAAQSPLEDENRYVAQVFQQMTLLQRHMPYPVNEALTNHRLWKLVLGHCQKKIEPLYHLPLSTIKTMVQEVHPKNVYYQAVFFKQCQLLAEDYKHYVTSLAMSPLTNEHFVDSATQSSIPFNLQNSKHIRRQIETYYQGNEALYFYGLAKAAHPLNVKAIKAALGHSQWTTTVTEEEAYEYVEKIKGISVAGLQSCREQGLILQGERQEILATNEPDYLLFTDYNLLHGSHLLSDVYFKVDATQAGRNQKRWFIYLLSIGCSPLPLTLVEDELNYELLNNPDALQCLLASLGTLITNYQTDSLHPLFVPSLPLFKKTIAEGETLLERCKGSTELKPNDKKDLLQLVDKLRTLEQGIDNQSAYLRTRGLTTKSQAHLPLDNEALRNMVYQFVTNSSSPTITSLLDKKKELNDLLDSIHGGISLKTLGKCIDYVTREPQWALNKENPPLITEGSQTYKSIRLEYGEVPIKHLIDTLVKRFHTFGGQELFTAIRDELVDNAFLFSSVVKGTISTSSIANQFNEERHSWACHANKLSRYYRGKHQPITPGGQKSEESSHLLDDIDTLWKNQPWQTGYGFSQTPKLPNHVKEVLRMQALLAFCHQKAPYFYAPYNVPYEVQNGITSGVIGLVKAPFTLIINPIIHPIDHYNSFCHTFFTNEGLGNFKEGLKTLPNALYHHPVRMGASSLTGVAIGYGGGQLWNLSHATTTQQSLLSVHTNLSSVVSYKVSLSSGVASTTTTLIEPSDESDSKNETKLSTETNSSETLISNSLQEENSGKLISIELTRESSIKKPVSSVRSNNIYFFKSESVDSIKKDIFSENSKEIDGNLMSSIKPK